MPSNKIIETPKQSILCWSDSAVATTGFGTVSKHILQALHATGKYTIDQLGINHPNCFHDLNKLPFSILPARLANPEDLYGYQMFLDALSKKDYDFVFIINDTYVVHEISKQALQEHINIRIQKNKKLFKIIYYYPIDCRLVPGTGSLISMADRAVAYTHFAARETIKSGLKATDIIYHGADIKSFYPIGQSERSLARRQFLGVDSNETFVLVNVNRNGMRKDMARTILAFSEFKKRFRNSVLYLHTCMVDGPDGNFLDLRIPVEQLGLTKSVIFPRKLDPAAGVNPETLNVVYNMADAFITTTLGEGFGLTPIESMCCNVPVIAPDNTALSELLGENRAYLYPCKEQTYIDNSGYRPVGHLQDILSTMFACYNDWLVSTKSDKKTPRDKIINNARQFVEQYSWDNINKQWVALFENTQKKQKIDQLVGEKL